LLNIFQRPQEKAETVQPQAFTNEVSHADSYLYDDYSLKPYNPSELYQRKGSYDLYDDMREDDQISSLLTLKKSVILNADIEIECENEDIIEFLQFQFNNTLDKPFNKVLFEILSAIDYGFSLTEKIVDAVDTPWGTKFLFTEFKTRPPHTFEIHTDDFGNISELKQSTKGGYITLDNRKFILYSYNKEFDNPYGTSDLNKGVYRAYWSKDAIIKFWNIYLERFGMPTHVGKLPRSAGEAEKDRFKQVLKNIQAKTGITIPNDFELELLEVAKGAGEYEKAINKYDTMIARKLLIPDLLGFSGGETAGGSYALGKEQFNIFYTVCGYTRKDLERIVNQHIVQPLVRWNFGDKYDAKFKLNVDETESQRENMKIWIDAVKSGKIPTTDKQINWFNRQTGAPEISEEELEAINEQKDAMRSALVDAQKAKEEKPNGSDEKEPDDKKSDMRTEEPEDPEKADEKKFSVDGPWLKEIDFVKIGNTLDELQDEYKKRLTSAFRVVINGLVDDIKRRHIVGKARLDLINSLKLRNMAAVKKAIKDMFRASFAAGLQSVELQKFETDDFDVEDWLEEKALYISDVEDAEILKQAKTILIEGIKGGKGIDQIAKQLSDALAGYGFSGARIETIVRTNVMDFYNQARKKQYEKMKDYIVYYQYNAILDGRTSPLCQRLHGKLIQPQEFDKYNPPNHHNCRSLLVPIFEDESLPLDKKYYDLPAVEEGKGNFLELKIKPKDDKTPMITDEETQWA